ncbi:endonuclease/exonuclease/phosphatase family protein [Phenylobacterium sp.]|uniref:endonuclease/exonuclease/phosphatase family protein n=1 Tax=Phenylobacterium sp. TaxID=1871053 RepID=UPI00398385EA
MASARVALTVLFLPPIVLGAVLCAGVAGAGHLGRSSLEWDILTHFAPIAFAGGLVAVITGLVLRGWARWLAVIPGAAAVLAAGALMAPEFLRDAGPRAAADAPGQLKLIQFNVWYGSQDHSRTLDWLAAQDADIIVLQETTPPLRAAIAARGLWQVTGEGREVMILSRMPANRRPLPALDGPAPLAMARFDGPAGDFAVIGVHYTWPTEVSLQQAQEARVARLLDGLPRDRAIVAGDFNSTPWSFSRRRWDREFGLIRRDRALFSWPAVQSRRAPWLGVVPVLPIDHVYAGAGWATVKVARGPRLASDHYPLIVTLAPVAPR